MKDWITFINEGSEEIGRRVKISNNAGWGARRATLVNNKEGLGTIIEYRNSDKVNYCHYIIIWDNDYSDGYNRKEFNFIENAKPRIRWYHNGKLSEKLNEVEQLWGKDVIGKKVRIRNDSRFYDQAFRNYGNGLGEIISYLIGNYPYLVRWDISGLEFGYDLKDFDIIDDLPVRPHRIRWYHNGKLEDDK